MLDTTSVGQSRGVEDADLRRRLWIFVMFTKGDTYFYAILARKFVKPRRVGLALVVRTTLLVGTVENVKVAMVNVVTGKDIG